MTQWYIASIFKPPFVKLTHWGRVTHICVGKLTIIGSDNGLSPGRRQAIIWTNYGILLIGYLGTNFSENFIEIHTFSFKKIDLKMSSGKWRPSCIGLNVLKRSFRDHIRLALFSIYEDYCWKFKYYYALTLVHTSINKRYIIVQWRIVC